MRLVRIQRPEPITRRSSSGPGPQPLKLVIAGSNPARRTNAHVAKLDNVPDYESGRWRFESSRARQFIANQARQNPVGLRLRRQGACEAIRLSRLRMYARSGPRVPASPCLLLYVL